MPASDELLLTLIYKDENAKVLSEAKERFEKMTDAEKALVRENAALEASALKVANAEKALANTALKVAEKEARDAGADYVGGADFAEKIEQGWLEFDRVIATPDMMGVAG